MKRSILSLMAMVVVIAAVLSPVHIDHPNPENSQPTDRYIVNDVVPSAAPTGTMKADKIPSEASIFTPASSSPISPEPKQQETLQAQTSAASLSTPEAFSSPVPKTERPSPGATVPNTYRPSTVTPAPITPAPHTSQPTQKPSLPASPTPVKSETKEPSLSYAEQVVRLVNQERAKEGLQPLAVSQPAQLAAQVRAQETETSFSHTRPDGASFSTALTEQGVKYRTAGENIAWGQKTPEQVMQGWMNSPGHRANIMNEKFTAIGVGYYRNASGVNYWTQLFIG